MRFNQPSSSSVVLNRVLGQDPSQLLGALLANGQVFLLNPNGVVFGKNAHVSVGGLLPTAKLTATYPTENLGLSVSQNRMGAPQGTTVQKTVSCTVSVFKTDFIGSCPQ